MASLLMTAYTRNSTGDLRRASFDSPRWLFMVHADPIASSDIYVIDGDTIDVRGRSNLPVPPSASPRPNELGRPRRHLLPITAVLTPFGVTAGLLRPLERETSE